jgi:hypothetical protein
MDATTRRASAVKNRCGGIKRAVDAPIYFLRMAVGGRHATFGPTARSRAFRWRDPPNQLLRAGEDRSETIPDAERSELTNLTNLFVASAMKRLRGEAQEVGQWLHAHAERTLRRYARLHQAPAKTTPKRLLKRSARRLSELVGWLRADGTAEKARRWAEHAAKRAKYRRHLAEAREASEPQATVDPAAFDAYQHDFFARPSPQRLLVCRLNESRRQIVAGNDDGTETLDTLGMQAWLYAPSVLRRAERLWRETLHALGHEQRAENEPA